MPQLDQVARPAARQRHRLPGPSPSCVRSARNQRANSDGLIRSSGSFQYVRSWDARAGRPYRRLTGILPAGLGCQGSGGHLSGPVIILEEHAAAVKSLLSEHPVGTFHFSANSEPGSGSLDRASSPANWRTFSLRQVWRMKTEANRKMTASRPSPDRTVLVSSGAEPSPNYIIGRPIQ